MARSQKAKIEYLDKKGEKVKVTDSPVAIRFVFADPKVEDINLTIKDLPSDILSIAAVRGVAEKVRDTYAGSDTVADAHESATDMIGRLVEGEWLSAREGGGPRMTMLLAAIKEVLEAAGKPFDLDASRAKYVTGKDDADEVKTAKANARKAAAANPQVAVVLERLKAEAAARRAEKGSDATVEALATSEL